MPENYRSASPPPPRARRAMSARWGRVLAWTALLTGLAATYALWLHSQRVAESHVERVLAHRAVLSRKGKTFARRHTWEKVVGIYREELARIMKESQR